MKPSSLRRIRASRANGARSRGPITPEGKARSSQNAIRHGLLAKCVVLAGESREGFDVIAAQHESRFAPRDGVDQCFVEEMVAAAWRLRRAWAMETRLFDNAVQAQPPGDERSRMAAALSGLAARPEFALLHRYETRLNRMYQRNLQNFLLLREALPPDEPAQPAESPGVPHRAARRHFQAKRHSRHRRYSKQPLHRKQQVPAPESRDPENGPESPLEPPQAAISPSDRISLGTPATVESSKPAVVGQVLPCQGEASRPPDRREPDRAPAAIPSRLPSSPPAPDPQAPLDTWPQSIVIVPWER
ncbi:MAG: hypothetical protein U0Q18_25975 [Bryobacteraceae bacterium]